MKTNLIFCLIAPVLLICSCGSDTSSGSDDKKSVMDADEREMCNVSGIDTNLIIELHDNARFRLDIFVPDSIWYFDGNNNYNARSSDLQGVMFEAGSDAATQLCETIGPEFISKGQTMYVFEQNFGIDNEKDKIAIVNTADKYEILRETATDGINYDITNDSVISIIKMFDTKYQLTLTGTGLDWCQFTIGKDPSDWNAFAEEVYAVCPDVVDQGTGSVEELAQEMKRTHTLYLWWD